MCGHCFPSLLYLDAVDIARRRGVCIHGCRVVFVWARGCGRMQRRCFVCCSLFFFFFGLFGCAQEVEGLGMSGIGVVFPDLARLNVRLWFFGASNGWRM